MCNTNDCHPIGCSSSDECHLGLACYQNSCVNPCEVTDVCGINALCEVNNHSPICYCPKTMTGDPFVSCRPFNTANCDNDEQCQTNYACINGKCQDICDTMKACAENAICAVHSITGSKTVSCKCKPGFTGNPYEKCQILKINEIECENDKECSNSNACLFGKCENPCEMRNPCSKTAKCRVINNRPVCYCPAGFTGNPVLSCTNYDCSKDSDCTREDVCLNNRCVDACSLSRGCGPNAKCKAFNHRHQCICNENFIGDPELHCSKIECNEPHDCDETKTCSDNRCIDICTDHSLCDKNEICYAHNHQHFCRCKPGLQLNKNNECVSKTHPQCINDEDCSFGLACLNNTCHDLCSLIPCGLNAKCTLSFNNSSHPNQSLVASSVCKCLAGFTGNPIIECKETILPISGCTDDSSCAQTDLCHQGRCQDACDIQQCGSGALCRAIAHRAVCSCPDLHKGDPQLQCIPGNKHLIFLCI